MNGLDYDFDVVKINLCYEFKWTEQEFNNQSMDFIFKCIVYVEELRKKKDKK